MKVALELDNSGGWKSFEMQTRNTELKGYSGDVSDGNGEHIIENWRKGNPCYEVAKNLACLCSSVSWMVYP